MCNCFDQRFLSYVFHWGLLACVQLELPVIHVHITRIEYVHAPLGHYGESATLRRLWDTVETLGHCGDTVTLWRHFMGNCGSEKLGHCGDSG